MTMTETIIQNDHERLRNTVTIKPEDVSDTLTSAGNIEWFLTTRPALGEGDILLSKDGGDVNTVSDDTFEVELTPDETAALPARTLYPECTITWADGPSTAELTPALTVRESAHEAQ